MLLKEEHDLLDFVQSQLIKERAVGISPVTPLFADRLIDSITIVDLIGYLERRLSRRLDDTEIVMSNFRSVQTIVEAFFHD